VSVPPLGWESGLPGKIGFGGYRVEENVAEHRQALEAFLDGGGRVLDTAANYTCGGSERLIGSVLAARGRARVTVVTKAGYLEPTVEGRAPDGLTRDYPERVRTPYGFFHCIHPQFLADAITRSLRRLRLERLDVFLLHNPEYFLTTLLGPRPKADPNVQAAFRARLEAAFAHLEGEVKAGRVGGYGVSSNNLGRPATDPVAVTVEGLLDTARAVSSSSAFSTVQCPLNLLERDAALPRPPLATSALDAARAAGLCVLTNRPINAMRGALVPLRDGRSVDARSEIYLDALRRALEANRYERLDGLRGWSLAHAALDLVRSLPEVDCVLNGMRRPAYVRMAHEVLAEAPEPRAHDILRGLY
jgi:aryl-alcohol dehydrogenase-like predicted oxidoreductase